MQSGLVVLAILSLAIAVVSSHDNHQFLESKLPWTLDTLRTMNKFSKLKSEESNGLSFPRWPDAFNCTLQKINPDDHDVQWTKLYYDWPNLKTSFIFYDWYMDVNGKWGPPNYRIYFINTTIWFDFPKEKNCYIRAKDIPTISPDWLKLTVYKGRDLWREMWSDLWEFPEGLGSLTGIKYYHRVSTDGTDDTKIPLRSTNQQGDPGVTDYTDFVVGPQHSDNFEIPNYCPKE